MSTRTLTLNVGEAIRTGREPSSKIMKAVVELRPDESLRLIAPFEPVPLFALLDRQDFQRPARPFSGGNWGLFFPRRAGTAPTRAHWRTRCPKWEESRAPSNTD